MSAALPNGTWYKPRDRFTFNGEPWSTNGYIAIAAETEAPEHDRSEAIGNILKTCTDAVTPEDAKRGWMTAGGAVFSSYLIDLVRQVHGEPTRWAITPTMDDTGPMMAFLGERPVAVVMPRRGMAGECKCPWCYGKGFAAICEECNGDGEVEHECSCGHFAEHECHDCDGQGGHGTCPKCDGTKMYRRHELSAEAT